MKKWQEIVGIIAILILVCGCNWHETKDKWLEALNKRNITNPQLHQVDSLYDDFANKSRLLFDPKTQSNETDR